MALKAVHMADVPKIDQVPDGPVLAGGVRRPSGMAVLGSPQAAAARGFVVVGHRGKGMNAVASSDKRMMAVRENSLLSFNRAGRFPVDFVEFDVQVTKDGFPIIFHDNVILTEEVGTVSEKRVTDLYLEEFLSYGPQRDPAKVGKSLLRRAKDGRILNWSVEEDDSLCTLQEAFQCVGSHLGFNIELKFDDYVVYCEEELTHSLQAVLRVFFLTEGGTEIYDDVRRNSLDEAIELCLQSGLQGIVSEVRGVLKNPSAVPRIKECKLALLTYGQLNNVPEAVYMQHLMGINGVIVDLVEEITEAVAGFTKPAAATAADESLSETEAEEGRRQPKFSQRELRFLLRLIPALIQH
ncbi:glycerophosphodiester phosphodiesterase GDPD1, chloroplastic-like isoform X2 [Typha latifolia]|uniref:glycerophosphodiester phosphodiesterase GDPD1, chloroplastic-like isoform X2 n=1 Tax=Typha latifolia TaxID=4733 RepID=UPI003C30E4CF